MRFFWQKKKIVVVFPLPRRVCKSRAAYLLGLLLWCFAARGAESKSDTPDVSRLSYDIWPVEKGWQPNTVTSIIQSRDGYLWLGTYNGLARFDGVRFTLFDSSTAPGLRNSRITYLWQDSRAVIWIGHETGELTRLEQGEFQPVVFKHPWPGGAIESIVTDDRDDLWLLNDRGLLFRLKDGLTVEAPGSGSAARKVLLTRSLNAQLWLVAGGKVATLDRGAVLPFKFEGLNDGDFFQVVLPSRNGGVWVMVNNRIRRFKDGRWDSPLNDEPGPQGSVTCLLETHSGSVLAGTLNDGLYLFTQNAAPIHFSRTNGLSHDWVRCLTEDHEGNIWLGTGAGLDSLRARKVRMLTAPDSFQGRAVLAFWPHADGSVWAGSEGAGLYHYQHGDWQRFTESSGLANLFVWSALETRSGNLFIGTWGGGLYMKNGDRFETPPELAGMTAPTVAMFEGSKGEVWIGTTSGLYLYEGGHVTLVAGKEQLGLPDVRAITQSADGALWFGMVGGGLGCLRDQKLVQYTTRDGLTSDFVQSLYAEADGTLWIGTSDKGLGRRLNSGKFSTIGLAQGLPNAIISHIVDDGAGNLWMGSHQGILRVGKADLNRCANGETKSVHCLSYGKAEGLETENCSGGFQPGACRTADGLLWFPTSKGLALIDPINVTTNRVEPPVVIEDLLVDGERFRFHPQSAAGRTAVPASIRIPAGKQRFEIHYAGLSFAVPEKVLFRYKLEGLERTWMDAGTRRVAEYSYLPPGSYTFHVIACNNDEVWNEVGASLGFTVLPLFWQTWWFRIAAILAGAAAISGAVVSVTRRRVRARLEQLERQQAIERERARIARDIHDDLGASLTRITMLSQSVRAELDDHLSAASDVDQIYGTARELTRAMDEIVWAVNPKHDTVDSLVTYLGRFAQTFLSAAGIRCRLDVPMRLPAWTLTAEVRHNVFLAFKEALNNVVKHAQASEVRISLELLDGGLLLLINDNGIGFEMDGFESPVSARTDENRLAPGNGLLNMRKRLDEIGGRCEWDTARGEGTRVKLVITVNS